MAILAACCASALAVPAARAEAGLTTAQAAELQQQIDARLRAVPGGTQTAGNQIAWQDGAVVLTLATPGQRAAGRPDCRWQRACSYAHANYGYPKLEMYACGTYDLAAYGMGPGTRNGVSSWHNNQSGGAWAEWEDSARRWLWAAQPPNAGNVAASQNDKARYFEVC